MNCILFDHLNRENLLPLTFTRPVSEIRIGILTITEKWNRLLNTECSFKTETYLQNKYKLIIANDNFYINGAVIPEQQIIDEITALKEGQSLFSGLHLIACRTSSALNDVTKNTTAFEKIVSATNPLIINYPWEIFRNNAREIENDYKIITKGRTSARLADTNKIIGENIFVEEGVIADFVTINARNAFVYLGKNTELMEGSLIRGSLALCENSILKLGARIYGPTTIGPNSKVGGEVNNSVILGNSNKAHDGYIGNSIIGEWCNLGADTNCSNLKNNYANVKVWNYKVENHVNTGLQFCGLIMGDHSKCGINTMFNTGTVVGVNSNIFGSGFMETFIPSFSWGGPQGFTEYVPQKAFETNELVMNRKNLDFNKFEKNILLEVFEKTKKFRKFNK
jgi:UDP-N-acetylglucosamine diphosphorylase/glucosamine-1-phosphate N-acetyltransferase